MKVYFGLGTAIVMVEEWEWRVAQIFNYVLDVKKAAKEIIKELENENLVEGVKISYLNHLNGQYITLYPS